MKMIIRVSFLTFFLVLGCATGQKERKGNSTGNILSTPECPSLKDGSPMAYNQRMGRCMPWEGAICKADSDCHSGLLCRKGFLLYKQQSLCDKNSRGSIDLSYNSTGCPNVRLCVSRTRFSLWKKRSSFQRRQEKFLTFTLGPRLGLSAFFTINTWKKTVYYEEDVNGRWSKPKTDGAEHQSWVVEMPFGEPLVLEIGLKPVDFLGFMLRFGLTVTHVFEYNRSTCRNPAKYTPDWRCTVKSSNDSAFLLQLYLEAYVTLNFNKDRFQVLLGARFQQHLGWLGSEHRSIKLTNSVVVPVGKIRYFFVGSTKSPFNIALETGLGFSWIPQGKEVGTAVLVGTFLDFKLSMGWTALSYLWR